MSAEGKPGRGAPPPRTSKWRSPVGSDPAWTSLRGNQGRCRGIPTELVNQVLPTASPQATQREMTSARKITRQVLVCLRRAHPTVVELALACCTMEKSVDRLWFGDTISIHLSERNRDAPAFGNQPHAQTLGNPGASDCSAGKGSSSPLSDALVGATPRDPCSGCLAFAWRRAIHG